MGGTSPADETSYDAIVLGGGPAGSAAATLLARWGRSVALVARGGAAVSGLAESLPPSVRKLARQLGVESALDAAGFVENRGNTLWWGDDSRSESFPDGATGWQVARAGFDAILLDHAETAGATVLRDATVREARTDGSGLVAVDAADGRVTLEAPWVLDCTGRAGVIARQGLRRPDAAGRTLALVGAWRRDAPWGLRDETHTLVESYADGWAWSVPVSPGTRFVTVMVDPRETSLAGDRRVAPMYRAELAKTARFRRMVCEAEPHGRRWACDASGYDAHQVTGPGFLLVGDAASFIDPLSSFGVKKALASAWLAAVAVHTCLGDDAMRGHALELVEAREREIVGRYRALSATFARAAAREHAHPFWTGRSAAGDGAEEIVSGVTEEDVAALRRDPQVLAALEALKASPGIRFRPGPGVRLVRRPAVSGRVIVLEEQLTAPGLPGPVRFLRGVDLPWLVRWAEAHGQVPDLFEAYNRARPPAGLPDFLGVLSVLVAKGALVNEADPSSPPPVA